MAKSIEKKNSDKQSKRMLFWNNVLFYGMIVTGIIYVLISKVYSFIYAVLIPTLIVSWVIGKLLSKRKINPKYELYVNLSLWPNLIGEYYFYYHWVYYDKVLHFLIPIFIFVIAYEYISRESKFYAKEKTFFYVLGITSAFEIFEYFQSGFFNFPSVGVYLNTDLVMAQYQDTIWDLFSGVLGVFCYLAFLKIKEIAKKK